MTKESAPVQPSLFDDPNMPPLGDVAQTARQIAENSTPHEYPDRTSEAARDQGWGTVEPADVQQTARDRKLANVRGAKAALDEAHKPPAFPKQ